MGAVYLWKNLDKSANKGSKNLVLKVLHGLEVVLMVIEGPKPPSSAVSFMLNMV